MKIGWLESVSVVYLVTFSLFLIGQHVWYLWSYLYGIFMAGFQINFQDHRQLSEQFKCHRQLSEIRNKFLKGSDQ